MAQNQDSNPARDTVCQALEEENRVLRQRLAGETSGLDLRLLRLTETLRQENLRLAGESEALGTKNIELVFQVEELEQQIQHSRAAADQALEQATKALQERDRALEQGRQATEELAERARSEAQNADRLEELARSSRADAQRLEAELARAVAEREQALEHGRQATEELAGRHREAERQGQLLEELQAELSQVRGTVDTKSLEAARAGELAARLQGELDAATARARELEATLERVQEQFLQRVEAQAAPEVAAPTTETPGPPDAVLSRLLASLLGPSGQHLVARVYARCQVDRASLDPQEIERVLQSLEETAARLLSTPDHVERLRQGLERLRAWLASPSPAEAPPAMPEAAPAPVEGAAPEAAPAAAPEPAASEPTAPLLVEAAPEALPAAAQEPTASEPTAPPVVEAASEPTAADQEPAVPEPMPTPAEDARQMAPGGIRPLGNGQKAEFHGVTDPALRKQIEEGNKLLSLEKFDQSWDIFQKLAGEHPQALPVLEGLFYNYVDSGCWVEAAEVGRRILYVELEGPGRARFVKAMHATLLERFKAVRDAGERKLLLLQLAELHLDDPVQAVDLLDKARQIPGRTPADARVDYYLARLEAGGPDGQLRSALGALEEVSERLDLFDCLDRATAEAAHRPLRPAAQVVLALVRGGRQQAAAAEVAGGDRVAAGEPDPNLVDEEHDEAADLVQEFVLNQLLPRAQVAIPFPDPTFSALLEQSEPVPAGWKPAEYLERLNWRVFRNKNVQARLYRGPEPFWLRVTPEPAPQVLFHPDVAGLPASEQQGLALRALFHLHHRHLHVLRASELLDPALRCRLLGLTRDVVQDSGTDVSDWIEREIDSLDPARPDLAAALDGLLDRLYNHCLREEFLVLRDLLVPGRLFAARLEGSADRFVSRLVGVTEASYGIARLEVGRTPLFARLESEGFQALYSPPRQEERDLRLRLQRLWLRCLR